MHPNQQAEQGDLISSYTKHYYIGAERIQSTLGTVRDLGLYPPKIEGLFEGIRTKADTSVQVANTGLSATYTALNQSISLGTCPYVGDYGEGNLQRYAHDADSYDAYWYHSDHLGSSSYITNLVGTVTQHIEYLPFGETLVDEHQNSYNTPFKFNGKELDEETGNYYYGARYYNPKWSVWLSVDPLAEKYPDRSAYNYTFNSPLNFIDPNGEEGVRVIDSKNKTITIKAVYYVQTKSRQYYTSNGKVRQLKGYSVKQIQKMNDRINNKLNKLDLNVSEGKYKGYSIKFDLEFKEGGTVGQSEDKARNEKFDGNLIGNSISRGNENIYERFKSKEIKNKDGTTSSSAVGGVTANNKDITMNISEDNIMNRVHEIFHTFGFEHPKGIGGKSGIMKYPPEKPNQNDANQLINTPFLPEIKL